MPGAVATLVVRITSDLAQFNAGMSKATSRLAATSTRWASLGSSLTKNLTLPILAIGGIAVAAAMDVGKGMRIIQQRTGETGKAAEELGKSFKTVLRNVPESAGKVAEAMSDLHIKTGLVGKPLENLTTQLLNLARITKSDVVETTTNAGKVFNNWAIATNDQGKALDYLYGVTTKTGIPINSLMGDLTKFGPQLRGVGFSFESSAALIGTFDKAGLQTGKVMMGLNAGLSKLAKAGKDPAVEFPKLINQIKNAGSASEATRLSVELFGTRGGPAMSDAIRSGKVNFEDLIKTLKKTPISINKTAKDTMTLGDRFKILKNQVSLALQPLGKGIMDAIKSILPIFSKIATVVGWVASVFSKIPGPIRTVIVVFALLLAAVGPVLAIGAKFALLGSNITKLSGNISSGMSKMVSGIKGLGPRLASMGSAAVGAMKSMASGISSALSFLAANPIILIIAAIVAVIVIAAILIKKYWNVIGPFLKKVWNGIKRAFDAVWGPIKRFLLAMWRPIVAAFKKSWGVIKVIFKAMGLIILLIVAPWLLAVILIKKYWSTIGPFLKKVWEGIKRVWHAVIDPLVRAVKAVWGAVKKAWDLVWGAIKAAVARIWRGLKKEWHFVIDPLVRAVKAVWHAVSGAWSAVWDGITGAATTVWDALKSAWHTVMDPLIDTVKAIWDGVKAAWGTVWDGIVAVVKGAVNLLIDGVNLAIRAINIISPFKDIPKIPHWGEKEEKPLPGTPGSEEWNKTFLPWMHGGGLVPTTGDYRLKAKEGVLSAEGMRGIDSADFRRLNSGLAVAGGGNITISPIFNLNSVSPEYDAKQFGRKVINILDTVARQGYHAGKLK